MALSKVISPRIPASALLSYPHSNLALLVPCSCVLSPLPRKSPPVWPLSNLLRSVDIPDGTHMIFWTAVHYLYEKFCWRDLSLESHRNLSATFISVLIVNLSWWILAVKAWNVLSVLSTFTKELCRENVRTLFSSAQWVKSFSDALIGSSIEASFSLTSPVSQHHFDICDVFSCLELLKMVRINLWVDFLWGYVNYLCI